MASLSANEIAADLEADITTGTYRPGDRLPAIRDLASACGVSPTTVAAGYRMLRDRGLVVGRGRQGTVVAPQTSSPAGHAVSLPDGIVDAMSGNPDARLLPQLNEAIATALTTTTAAYGQPLVDPLLADVATRLFAADHLDPANLTVTNGAMDAVSRIMDGQNFRSRDRIGVEDPGHVPVHQLVRSSGLDLVPIAVDSAGPTVESVRSALATGLSALVISPRAQNPTGAALTPARAADLNALLADHPDVVVIVDDHAGPISGSAYEHLTTGGPHWAVIRSLGKTLGPDLRLAVVIGDQRTIARLSTSVSNGPGWVSHLLQRSAAILLNDPSTESLIATATTSYARRRKRLIDTLARGGVASEGASSFNVWIPVPAEQAAIEVVRSLGYAVRAGDAYRLTSGPAIRVTISNLDDADIDKIAAGLITHLGAGATAPSM